MIECVFTVDYEIYGNGRGSLQNLVYEPAERLRTVFREHNARFVVFPDVAELEMIDGWAADPFIGPVKEQLRDFNEQGFELGLHIHPWWYNAKRENGAWVLDQGEYNLCAQPVERIGEVIRRAVGYMRDLLGAPGFTPLSFRAGHLLFQPTQPLAGILAANGIRLDSSVYRGGLWRLHKLDYRRAPKKDLYWRFGSEVTEPDPRGILLEIPIYTRLVPVWRLLTGKRVSLQQTGASKAQVGRKALGRLTDFLRFRYPLKLDLGQMTKEELNVMMDRLLKEDERDPSRFRPVVAIVHTKDPIDHDAVNDLLARLGRSGIPISTFVDIDARVRSLTENIFSIPTQRIVP
jgi:hypothetical protein